MKKQFTVIKIARILFAAALLATAVLSVAQSPPSPQGGQNGPSPMCTCTINTPTCPMPCE
jgi:hypothetical protein